MFISVKQKINFKILHEKPIFVFTYNKVKKIDVINHIIHLKKNVCCRTLMMYYKVRKIAISNNISFKNIPALLDGPYTKLNGKFLLIFSEIL